ncbi:MAG: glycosyltransferase 87 family protein [Crocinitomicaceae bacterium]|nr:glycosyltransferase 87 family protein [Crocinitomicaceae bacterium]
MKSYGAIWRVGIILVFICSIFLVNWESDRENLLFIGSAYSFAFLAYLLILRENYFSFKHLIFIALGAQVASMIFLPNLSEDYFRFLWDGKITFQGINPFDFTPNELIDRSDLVDKQYLTDVYAEISDLSRKHYSCYPPVNQVYFIIPSLFSNSIAVNTFVMKLLVVLTELAGIYYLRKLLIHFKVDPKRLWLVYLNPLLIIECTGNVHFEGVMLSLLFIALYFLFTSRLILGAVIFALAVQIKLVPLILLPFFLRYFPWKKAFLMYFVIGATVIGLGLTQLNSENIYHFLSSLRLYFQDFGFNAFLFDYYNEIVQYFTFYNPLAFTGPIMSFVVMVTILFIALWKHSPDWKVLLRRMLFAFFIYLIMGATLHPWYVIPLLGLSLFTNYAFATVWSFLIFFSYISYLTGYWHSFEARLVTNIEYILLLSYFIYEWRKGGSPFSFLRIDYYRQPNPES